MPTSEVKAPLSVEDVPPISAALVQFSPSIGRLISVAPDGHLIVEVGQRGRVTCQVIVGACAELFASGDQLLLTCTTEGVWVVLGKIASYRQPSPQRHLAIDASDSLSITCGQSSIQLRADGKVMICGEDVLVRAKGSKRIRASTVSIN